MSRISHRGICLLILIIILLPFTYFLSNTFTNSPWENYHAWRQSDTYSIAEIYSEEGIDLLNPQFYYDSSENQTVQLELQILPLFGLTLSNITGLDLALALRLVAFFFFLGSGLFIYLIGSLYLDKVSSAFSLILYFLTPLSVLLSRAIMPESMAMFFYLGAVYFFLLWYRRGINRYSYLSAIFLSFAIILKIPIAFFGLAVIYMFIEREKLHALRDPKFYSYGIIALLPSIVYFGYMSFKSQASFVSGIASQHVFSDRLFDIFSLESFRSHLSILWRYFGPIVLALALGGLALVILNRRLRVEIMPWALSIFLEVLIICSIIKFDYYYIFLVPVLALLGGVLINEILRIKVKLVISLTLSLILLYNSLGLINSRLVVNEDIDRISGKISQSIDRGSSFGINYYSPAHINAVATNGARIGLDYYEEVPKDREEEILFWVDNGIENFSLIKSMDSSQEFAQPLDKYGIIIYEDEELIIYKVRR